MTGLHMSHLQQRSTQGFSWTKTGGTRSTLLPAIVGGHGPHCHQPLLGVKKRVRKRGKALCTPYTAGEQPKRKKKETIYDPLRGVEDARVNALIKWTSGTKAPMTIRGGTTEMTHELFHNLMTPGTWISNEVWIISCLL